MELREFILLFRKEQQLFFGLTALFVALGFFWQIRQPVNYEATLLLNIGRSFNSSPSEYSYDSFYRLQADERFADTVVRWLGAPRIVEDIYSEVRKDSASFSQKSITETFTSARLSSQVISVTYDGKNKKEIESLARALVTILNRSTESLSVGEKEQSSFVVLGSDPVIRDNRTSLVIALSVALLVGFFVSFWTVLIRHYYQTK